LGTTGTWTWTVTNSGPATVDGVDFWTDPSEKVLVTAADSAAGPCGAGGGHVSCALGTIAVGASVTVHAQYDAIRVGRDALSAHVNVPMPPGPEQANTGMETEINVASPVGGIARVSAPRSVQILRTGGVRLRVTPAIGGTFSIDGTVTTPSGPVRLTHVDLRNVAAHTTNSIWLGTTPMALARIGRALRTTKRLHARITVSDAGAAVVRTVTLMP
jgi:hypothetical protein